jgi:pimeloyl-ACP methyl ester carboxylesterase
LGVVLYVYSFVLAPRYLFGRRPETKPYVGQKPPPHLFRAFLSEVYTAFLCYSIYLLAPFMKGVNQRPGHGVVPVILVHGYAVSGSSWYWLIKRLERLGVRRPIYVLNYNWLSPVEKSAPKLGALIEQALSQQNAAQVDIVTHSWGGFLSRWCIEELGMCDRVRHLIMICTPLQGTWVTRLGFGSPRRDMMIESPVLRLLKTAPPTPPYATIWTDCDEIVCPPQFSLLGDPDGNPVFVRQFHGISHLSMLRDERVAALVARLLEAPDAWNASAKVVP